MSALAHYFAMGGYARFVWPAYGIALAVLVGIAFQSWRRYGASRRLLDELQRGQPQRARRQARQGGER